MRITTNISKKIPAILLAAAMVISFSITAYAAPMEGERESNTATSLEEVPEQNASVTEKLTVPLDFSGLEYQVALANGLSQYDYTTESWKVFKDALVKSTIIIDEAKDQNVIDGAETELKDAIAGLVKMDYSELEKALGLAYSMMEENSGYIDIWTKIEEAADKARKALISGDQTAVTESTEELYALIEEAKEYTLENGKEPEIVIKEVEVQVPPSDDFCNIPGHKAWPVLFAISAVLNVAMAALIVFIIQKKRNTDDTVPLVQYDIDDDMYFDDIDDIDESEETEDDGEI